MRTFYRPRVFILMMVALSLRTSAQLSQGTAGGQAAAQTAVVQGTVIRAGVGQPLKRARVNLRRVGAGPTLPSGLPAGIGGVIQQAILGAANTQAVTDDSGRYVFNGVAPGQYRIAVDRDGYIHQEFGQRSFTGPGTIITLAAGQQLANVDIQMVPAGSISGRVFNEDGEPVANVQIQAQAFSYQQGKRVLMPSGQASPTNDLGEYRIYWLPPGDYYISANVRRGPIAAVNPVVTQQAQAAPQRGVGPRGGGVVMNAQQQNDAAYPPTYFPGTIVPESATPVSVPAAGDVRGIDFGIRPTATVSVKGQVLVPLPSDSAPPPAPSPNQRGNPGQRGGRGAQINVVLTRMSSTAGGMNYATSAINRTSVRQDGTFEITNVIPGSYNLSALAMQNGQDYSARMRLEIGDGGVNNLSIPLRAGIPIPGKLFVDGALPTGFKMSQLRVSLQPSEDFGVGGRNGGNAQVADDGTFTLTNVSPLVYRVRVAGLPTGAYVMAGRIGSDDAVNQSFTITGDQQVNLQLQIGFSSGRVSGTVVDDKGNPYPGALATLIPDDPARQRSDLYFSIPTDQYGHFTFSSVPPGGYKLFAWDDISGDAYQDPDFIRRYEDRGTGVKVDGGASVEQQVGITRR